MALHHQHYREQISNLKTDPEHTARNRAHLMAVCFCLVAGDCSVCPGWGTFVGDESPIT